MLPGIVRPRFWLIRCWQARSGRVSTQMLNEFYVNLEGINGEAFKTRSRAEMRPLMAWHPYAIDGPMLENRRRRGRVALGRLIVAAAIHQDGDTLLSEDLQHGQTIEGVWIVNPFRETP